MSGKRCSTFFDPSVKPPCVRCGRESEAWLINDNNITRVCRPCAKVAQALCCKYQEDRELHCVVADGLGYTDYVLINGQWHCSRCLSKSHRSKLKLDLEGERHIANLKGQGTVVVGVEVKDDILRPIYGPRETSVSEEVDESPQGKFKEVTKMNAKRCSVFFDPLVKPPCVRCGEESVAWLDNDGCVVRVCQSCGESLQWLCQTHQGRELHCSMAIGDRYADYVLVNGEWIALSLPGSNKNE